MRSVVALMLVVSLGVGPGYAAEAGAVTDADVLKGVQQVEDGEYDTAIITLDGAARRLAGQNRPRDLAQAYLYLGIAYFGKGQEAAAKARFREAVRQIGDLSLSPDRFPPKVVNLFEAARDEVGAARASAAPAAAPATTTEKKGGGSATPLIIGGAALAAGAGIAVAVGGGGNPPPPPTPPPAATPTAAPTPPAGGGGGGTTETFTGSATAGAPPRPFAAPVMTPGTLTARLTWTSTGATLKLELLEVEGNRVVAEGRPIAAGSVEIAHSVTPRPYVVHVTHVSGSPSTVDFTLQLTRP